MRKVSLREYQVWCYRMHKELEKPSRNDYYVMRVAAEIRRIFNLLIKSDEAIVLKDFELVRTKKVVEDEPKTDEPKTDGSKQPPKPVAPKQLTEEEKQILTQQAKSRWASVLIKKKTEK